MSEREYKRRMRDAEVDDEFQLVADQFWRFFEVALEYAERDTRGPWETPHKDPAWMRACHVAMARMDEMLRRQKRHWYGEAKHRYGAIR